MRARFLFCSSIVFVFFKFQVFANCDDRVRFIHKATNPARNAAKPEGSKPLIEYRIGGEITNHSYLRIMGGWFDPWVESQKQKIIIVTIAGVDLPAKPSELNKFPGLGGCQGIQCYLRDFLAERLDSNSGDPSPPIYVFSNQTRDVIGKAVTKILRIQKDSRPVDRRLYEWFYSHWCADWNGILVRDLGITEVQLPGMKTKVLPQGLWAIHRGKIVDQFASPFPPGPALIAFIKKHSM